MTRPTRLGIALLAASPAAAQDRPAPAAVAERIVSVASLVGGEGPIWSPDGARILYPAATGGLLAVPAAGGPAEAVTAPFPAQLVRLAPDGRTAAFLSDQGGNPELWLAPLGGGAPRPLTRLGARINALSWSPDGQWIAFSALRYGQFDLWKVRVADGAVTRLTDDARYEINPVWTPDGKSLLYFRPDDRWADHDLMILPADGGPARVITTDRDLFDYGTIGTRSRVGYPQVSPDGKWVLFKSHRSGWVNYWLVAVAGGAPRALAAETADQSDARWSPDGRSVAYVANRNGAMDLRIASPGGESQVAVPVSLGVIAAPEWSPDGTRIAYTLATPTRAADLYVAPAAGGEPKRLTESTPDSVAATFVTPEKVSWRSGPYTITGYLFRPRVPAGTAPGIMLIHGGPTGQFADTYLPQAQFLAAMGYAVLAPNIRGSSGFGKAFEDANNPCWTRCDLPDVLAGVEFLKRQPEVDRNHIGITGNSYGGIMTMGAVARAPGVFHAAAAQSGYADWISFQDYNTELQHSKLLAYEWGPYPDSAAVYRRNSSIFVADQVTTPTFLIYGVGQSQAWRPGVLPIPASLEFAHALDRRHKVVKVKTYPGETYYVTSRDGSKQVLLDLLDWFDRYLKDGIGPVKH